MIRRLLSALVIGLPSTVWALADHVLLIGVTDYAPEVAAIAQPLEGPGNDIALMLDVFRDAGHSRQGLFDSDRSARRLGQ